jgi:DNA-binding NarL/FixJ family response regulator
MGKPRVLLADDHALVVEAFKKLEAGVEILGTVKDERELLSTALRLKPDVIVIELGIESLNGLSAGQELKGRLPTSKLIVLSMNENYDIAIDALRRWASACVLKKSAGSELLKAIREVVKGKSYVTRKVSRRLLDTVVGGSPPDHLKSLTARQREVLRLLAEGRTMKQVAAILNLSARTIAFHKYHIMEEFGLKTNSDLIRFAIREHILT